MKSCQTCQMSWHEDLEGALYSACLCESLYVMFSVCSCKHLMISHKISLKLEGSSMTIFSISLGGLGKRSWQYYSISCNGRGSCDLM